MCIFGHKYGKVEKDGYQYCIRCGKGIPALCAHDWVNILRIKGFAYGSSEMPSTITEIYECSKCKKIRKEQIY